MYILLALVLVSCCPSQGKVALPFWRFLEQKSVFSVETNSVEDTTAIPDLAAVPLVMRMLFDEAERVSIPKEKENLPQRGDFRSMARSIKPTRVEEVGLQRVVLDFPPMNTSELMPGTEVWLVFQLRQSYMLAYNCTQVLTVYENDNDSLRPLMTIPLVYNGDHPLLEVNITLSMSQWWPRPPSYVVIIKDSTSYSRDERLFSFANYIDCSLARACEVLELHDEPSTPVLVVLSQELAAKNLTKVNRMRRSIDSSGEAFKVTADEGETYDDGVASNQLHDEDKVDEGLCRLKEWYVNTEQMGWEWLVYPERIPLNLCVGKCPSLLRRSYNATSHAVARGLYRLIMGPEAMPENKPTCCVPVRYKRFTMLIEKTPGIISLETSSDLSASQCGCR